MGVDFYRCNDCGAEVNDSKGNYKQCDGCSDVYCDDCENPMTCYADDEWQCPDCDPYRVHVKNSKLLKWIVEKYLTETTLEKLQEEYIKTLPPPKVLVCGECEMSTCHNLYENTNENANGNITVGWCCRCGVAEKECNVCSESYQLEKKARSST